MCVFGEKGVGVWMGVGRPCPPVRNDIVTPRHLVKDWDGCESFLGAFSVIDSVCHMHLSLDAYIPHVHRKIRLEW